MRSGGWLQLKGQSSEIPRVKCMKELSCCPGLEQRLPPNTISINIIFPNCTATRRHVAAWHTLNQHANHQRATGPGRRCASEPRRTRIELGRLIKCQQCAHRNHRQWALCRSSSPNHQRECHRARPAQGGHLSAQPGAEKLARRSPAVATAAVLACVRGLKQGDIPAQRNFRGSQPGHQDSVHTGRVPG